MTGDQKHTDHIATRQHLNRLGSSFYCRMLMKAETIQTLHLQEGKINKKISLEKYTFIRNHLIAILAEQELTHTALYA